MLKPDGRVVLTAWGPLERNRYVAAMLTPFLTRVDVPPPPPGSPQPLRFAQPGKLADERAAALSEVIDGLREYYDGEQVNFPTSIVVASAMR